MIVVFSYANELTDGLGLRLGSGHQKEDPA